MCLCLQMDPSYSLIACMGSIIRPIVKEQILLYLQLGAVQVDQSLLPSLVNCLRPDGFGNVKFHLVLLVWRQDLRRDAQPIRVGGFIAGR